MEDVEPRALSDHTTICLNCKAVISDNSMAHFIDRRGNFELKQLLLVTRLELDISVNECWDLFKFV